MGEPRQGRIGRLARLVSLTTGLAASAAASAAHGGAPAFHRRAARLLRDVLGEMKGIPMKVGQLLSYIDDFLPPDHREIYRETLRDLQTLAQPMSWKTVRGIVRPERFASVEEVPLAAASIGQVHGAVLKDGTEVVLKVQYPGIAKAIRSDLANLELLKKVFAVVLPRFDTERSMADLVARMTEECDYGCELCSQEEFGRIWSGNPEVVVPRVFPELSDDQVLVSERIRGLSWQEKLARSDQAEKNRIGHVLFRFVFRSLYGYGLLNADPHPGNYLFLDDGRVAFLDFGCVQRYGPDAIRDFHALRRLLMEGVSGAAVRAAVVKAYALPDMDEEEWEFTDRYVELCFAPVLASGSFRYSRDYGARLGDLSQEGAFLFARKALKKGVQESRREGFLFLNRLTYGFASIMGALEAEGGWREEIDRIDAELSLPPPAQRGEGWGGGRGIGVLV
jgi:predicted unusual protein kinase regulating ubiquinone biosynthesis (AarF/ABC1/UbiB family)